MPPPSNTEAGFKLVGTGLQSQVNPAKLRCDFYCISNKIKKTVLFAKVPIVFFSYFLPLWSQWWLLLLNVAKYK